MSTEKKPLARGSSSSFELFHSTLSGTVPTAPAVIVQETELLVGGSLLIFLSIHFSSIIIFIQALNENKNLVKSASLLGDYTRPRKIFHKIKISQKLPRPPNIPPLVNLKKSLNNRKW